MSDFLDDRLAALGDTPVPPLAPAELVRRRGEQRRTRTRIAAGAAGLAVVFVAGATAYGVTGRDSATLQYAPQPSREPSPAPSATPAPEQTRAQAPVAVDATLLLGADDAARIAGGRWRAGPLVAPENFPLLQTCATADVHGDGGSRRVIETGSQSISSQVVLFPVSAAEVLTQLRSDVARCPTRREDSEDGLAFATHSLQPGAPHDSVVIRMTLRDCANCTAHTSLWIVVGEGNLVSYTGLSPAEMPRLAAWADAARARLGCTPATCSNPPTSG